MWRNFRGTLSGSDLEPTSVLGHFQLIDELPAPLRHGRFVFEGQHPFGVGEVYHLSLEKPPVGYDIRITEVGPDPEPIVDFVTVGNGNEAR